ncbi:MAG: 30S ribosomal protein S5 [Planctomycetota bacterium]
MGARGRGRGRGREPDEGPDSNIDDTLVKLYRCACVVKGGRRFSFGALVVVGDRDGKVGFGYGKANEVPPAVEKGIKQAKRQMFEVPLRGTTIPHRITGRFGSSRVILIPASEGTGVIAGSAPRAVLELAGIKDVLTKSYGSTSPKNLVKATINGLQSLRSLDTVERLRGVRLDLPRKPKTEVPHTEAYIQPDEKVTAATAIAATDAVPDSGPQPATQE